ncbi:MAG: outer membrane lipoprotein-sorting protein, partial [Bacteroidetes bacterium]|nr:outer membrane lipoprotein-sorting protein [Bacteroidota bacterium]
MNTTIRTIASAVLITLATAAQAQTGRDIAQKVKD